jgi:hypothetical protein
VPLMGGMRAKLDLYVLFHDLHSGARRRSAKGLVWSTNLIRGYEARDLRNPSWGSGLANEAGIALPKKGKKLPQKTRLAGL